MKDYFNLSTEERRELRNKRDSRPEKFAKPIVVEEIVVEETTTTTTTTEILENGN